MNLSSVQPDDVVLVDKRGYRFHAVVTEAPRGGEIRVRPIDQRTTWRHATAREVVAHWRKSKASRA